MSELGLKERVAELARLVLAGEARGTYLGGREIYDRALANYPDRAGDIKKGTFDGYLSVAASSGLYGLTRRPGKRGVALAEDSGGARSTPSEPPPGDESAVKVGLREEWLVVAAERLVEILELSDLKVSLGPDQVDNLDKILRAEKRRMGAPDRGATKRELIELVLLLYGRDLLTIKGFGKVLRERIALRVGVEAPGKFHPGRDAAREFVEQCNLPIQLAGEYSRTSREPYVDVEPHPRARPLEDYQKECQRNLLRRLVFKAEGERTLLCLPTGAGKTLVAVNSIFVWMKGKFEDGRGEEANFVIWIAQREELCEQALEEFSEEWRSREGFAPIRLVRFWGTYCKDRPLRDDLLRLIRGADQPIVLFTTYSRLLNELQSDWDGADANLSTTAAALDLVVIDEAHHAAAPSYKETIRILQSRGAGFHVLGLTATPFRTSSNAAGATTELRSVFGDDSLVFPGNVIGDDLGARYQHLKTRLIHDEVLATEVAEYLHTDVVVRLTESADSEGERFEKIVSDQLSDRAKLNRRHDIIRKKIEAILSENPKSSILYFGPSVDDAFAMNALLIMSGVYSAAVTEATGMAQRRRVVTEFRAGDLRVLCNYGVLTTGFDAPCVTHVIVARPTQSQVLYTQMIGRGLRGRKFNGTSKCTIVNVVDDFAGAPVRLAFEEYIQEWAPSGVRTPP